MSSTTPSSPTPDSPASSRPSHPYASLLRARAAAMRELAATIERSSVMRLLDVAEVSSTTDLWAGDRADLCERLLSGDLHRLHAAAEQLRLTAFGFAGRADQLDGAAALRGVA